MVKTKPHFSTWYQLCSGIRKKRSRSFHFLTPLRRVDTCSVRMAGGADLQSEGLKKLVLSVQSENLPLPARLSSYKSCCIRDLLMCILIVMDQPDIVLTFMESLPDIHLLTCPCTSHIYKNMYMYMHKYKNLLDSYISKIALVTILKAIYCNLSILASFVFQSSELQWLDIWLKNPSF